MDRKYDVKFRSFQPQLLSSKEEILGLNNILKFRKLVITCRKMELQLLC